MKRLCVLGITGSIGQNVADIVKHNQDDFKIIGVAFNNKVKEFEAILKDHLDIKYVEISSLEASIYVKNKYPHLEVIHERDGLLKLIDCDNYDMVVNALVGFSGLEPTIYALEKNIDVALANKESLVVGGELINDILKRKNVNLYPIDSEHVALDKCLKDKNVNDIEKLIITASGGSFRDLSREELENVTLAQALNHPSWKMGDKITIDSATMMNKGFEIIEAHYLFNMPLEKIDVLMHDESVIHSLVMMKDHSLQADLGVADMRVPIAYALYGKKYHQLDNVGYLSLEKLGALHFRKYDEERYPALLLAKKALVIGNSMPCVLNAANEAANEAFRKGKLKFNKIENIIEKVMNEHKLVIKPSLKDLIQINDWAYSYAYEIINKGETEWNF